MAKLALGGACALCAIVGAALLGLMVWLVQADMQTLAATKPKGEQTRPNVPLGELQIEGKCIERLTLQDAHGKQKELQSPGPAVSLPAGKYRVWRVELKGGNRRFAHSISPASMGWTELLPGKPYRLQVGSPLTPNVRVSRRGRFLELNYELLDAGGRNYTASDRTQPPQFTVTIDNRQVGSGSFEYG